MFVVFVLCVGFFVSPTAHAYTFYIGDYYYLVSALDESMVVDVSGGSKNDEANIQLYEKNGTDAQLFRIARSSDGYYGIIYLFQIISIKILAVKLTAAQVSSQATADLYCSFSKSVCRCAPIHACSASEISPFVVIALYSRYPVKQSSSASRMISGVAHSSSPAQVLALESHSSTV